MIIVVHRSFGKANDSNMQNYVAIYLSQRRRRCVLASREGGPRSDYTSFEQPLNTDKMQTQKT